MRPTLALTAALTAALALLAAACTSGDPTEATPPPEATTPAPTSTPRPTSTPERTPTPEPTPEVQWDENGLPLGIEGTLIVLHDGEWVRILTTGGQLLNSIEVGHSVRLGGLVIAYIDRDGAWLARLDGRRELVTSDLGQVTYVLPADTGDLALAVSSARSGELPTAEAFSVVVRSRGEDAVTPYTAFEFSGGFEPSIAFWRDAETVVVASISGSEAPPQFATLTRGGEISLLGDPSVPWFSPDRSAWGFGENPFNCLETGSPSIVVESLIGPATTRRVGGNDEALRVVAIAPGGTEFVYSAQPLDGDGDNCRWALAPAQLVLVDAEGTETVIEQLAPTLDRWGMMPPFDADCVDLSYRFCPSAHDVAVDALGRVVFSPGSAHIVFLGTVDLPPP